MWDESGEEAEYTGWAPGQPNPDYALPLDCVYKSNSPEHLGWWQTDCPRVSAWGVPILALCEADIL